MALASGNATFNVSTVVFSGQAQVRLSSLLRRFSGWAETSTCDVAGYPGALSRLAARLLATLKPQSCLGASNVSGVATSLPNIRRLGVSPVDA